MPARGPRAQPGAYAVSCQRASGPALSHCAPVCSHNVWHAWGEGLARVFTTLREQGYLQLARVHANGTVT